SLPEVSDAVHRQIREKESRVASHKSVRVDLCCRHSNQDTRLASFAVIIDRSAGFSTAAWSANATRYGWSMIPTRRPNEKRQGRSHSPFGHHGVGKRRRRAARTLI